MEEKERYEWNSRFDEAIKDNQTGDIVNAVEVLNQQDKRIKELEDLVIEYKNKLYRRLDQVDNLIKENQQLKQSQKQLAVSELEKIYNLFKPYENSQKDTILCANNGISFVDYLENQIKSLKGRN